MGVGPEAQREYARGEEGEGLLSCWAGDPSGCGPCLLQEEKSRCNVNSGAGRGYNAGGPMARTGGAAAGVEGVTSAHRAYNDRV
eukprot:746547-Hanusia_phi.AAC.7